MGKFKKIVLLAAVILSILSLTVIADSPTGQRVLCSYVDADKTLTLNVYVTSGNAIVGYCSFDYDSEVLSLLDSAQNAVPEQVPANNASGGLYLKDIVSAKGGIVITDVGKTTSKLVNTKDGYVLFAWYLPESSDTVDASNGEVLIAQVKFALKEGKTYSDINNDSIKLAEKQITDAVGNWYSGILALDSEQKKYATSDGSMQVEVKYEYDFSPKNDDGEQAPEAPETPETPEETTPETPETPENPEVTQPEENQDTEQTEAPENPEVNNGEAPEEKPEDNGEVTPPETEDKEENSPSQTQQPDEEQKTDSIADFGVSFEAAENSVRIRWQKPEARGEILGYELTVYDSYGNLLDKISDISPITNSYTVRNLGGGFAIQAVLKAYLAEGFTLQSEVLSSATLPVTKYTQLISFNVTYDGGNGYLYGFRNELVVFGMTPTKAPAVIGQGGYKFSGWSVDGKNAVELSDLRIYSDITLYALYDNAAKAYMTGYDNGTFKPMGNVTRAEIAALAARVSGLYAAQAVYTSHFSDCTSSDWFYNYVGCCTVNEIISGYEDNTFRPAQNVTRAEFTAIVARIFGFVRTSEMQSFADMEGHWADGYVAALYDAGCISPDENGNFRPNEKLTRLDAVKILNAAQGIVPDKAEIDAYVLEKGAPFSDVTDKDEYYYDVLSAVLGI